jgi:aryl-alcohol dehydrogenase-like predicted oxidoreductase
MKRRALLGHGAALAGLAALKCFSCRLYAAPARKLASDRLRLGPMRVELSRMALGTGTNGVGGSSNQTRKLGLRGLADLLAAGYDQGVTFWDSADQYGTHPHLKAALQRVPREKVTILSKTHAYSERDMRADLERFRRELGTDYIDILLLHAVMDAGWPERRRGAMAVLEEARQKGIVRTCGASCHTLEALKTAARSPWAQVNLVRINPAGVAMDAGLETVLPVLRQMKAAGKGVIGMKILGAGRLSRRADECLQFVLSLDCVDCFTLGCESRAHLEDLLQRIPAASVRG